MTFACGKWRLTLNVSRPLVDIWVEWPKRWGFYLG